jgi:hypothetical protein
MNVMIRKWRRSPPALVEVGEVRIDGFNGLAFRQTDERPTLSVNFKNLRVTEIFLHAGKKDTLIVYCEEVEP